MASTALSGSVALADRVFGREGGDMQRRRQVAPFAPELSAFAGYRFPPEVILLAVRCNLRP